MNRRSALWSTLDGDEQAVLGELMAELLATRRFEAARGFELTDEIRTLVAGQACLLVLGLDLTWFDEVETIVVHPGRITRSCHRPGSIPGSYDDGDLVLDGEAAWRGPVVLAWDAVRFDARHPRQGRDVVLHELAHKIDMLDHVVDGTPPLTDPGLAARWVDVCTREFTALRHRPEPDPLLDDYAATDAGEFFAVATETFFTRGPELRAHKPALYQVLADFYGQDPADRLPR